MENEIIALVAKSGVFAILFVILLFYVLRENNTREMRYEDTIQELTSALGALEEIKVDVKEIKKFIKVNYPKSLSKFTYKQGECYAK